ncbi:hypothetical protein [Parasediminibacterium sp. JCM 36343]|uniref:hypothetical protein n=1 Tax=Parasediminibacterium sp. JCM 36343 TaxID=3374279 RepID=UPI00397C08ED
MTIDCLPFLVYLLLFCFIITRVTFFRKSGIRLFLLVGIFCLKVGVGVLYGLYFNLPSQSGTADTWRFYRESLPETQLLLHEPLLFVKSLVSHGYAQAGNLFVGANSYWNDLKDNIIIKLLAIANVFTRSNYYVDIVFFNFCYLFGLVAFYKLVKTYSNTHKYLLIIGVFLLPSFLFWCSGIHKDGLLFSALGIVFYSFQKVIKKQAIAKHYLFFALAILFIFFIKNYLALALVPALASWWLADRNHQRHQFYFIAVYMGGLLALMIISLLGNGYNALYYLTNKHQEFLLLNGASAIKTRVLAPTIESVVKYLPTAIDIAFFRPHISEIKNAAYAMSFAEIIIYLIITIAFLWLVRNKKLMPPFYICCFYFALSILLLDGYIVTFTGAIVRYRSLVAPLLIAPMMGMIPFREIALATRKNKII